MIAACESCKNEFLTEADPHLVVPLPAEVLLFCSSECYRKEVIKTSACVPEVCQCNGCLEDEVAKTYNANMKSFIDKGKGDWTLFGSAPSIATLIEEIAAFYYCSVDEIEVKDASVFNRGELLEGVRVIKKGNRFRFEGVVL